MSSRLSQNEAWDAEPKGLSEPVNQRNRTGTRLTNSQDDLFYALYLTFSLNRDDLVDYIGDVTFSKFNTCLHSFTDRANPFYRGPDAAMYGVPREHVPMVVESLREDGYIVERRDDVSQFCFSPRPTVGEIVVMGRDKGA